VTSQVVHKLLRLAHLRAEYVAVAAHCFKETRLPKSGPWSVPAPGHRSSRPAMSASGCAGAQQQWRPGKRDLISLNLGC
jgi:hypothetical protein